MLQAFELKRYMPRNLLGRTLLIVVMPLIGLQVVSAFIFYENHWETVRWRLSSNLAGDIAVLMNGLRGTSDSTTRRWLIEDAAPMMRIAATFKPGEILPNREREEDSAMASSLAAAMRSQVRRPFTIDTHTLDEFVIINVQLRDGVLQLVVTKKRLFTSTTYVFVLWMVGTSLILLGVATIFMRNQVRPILRLARAADDFGKGRDVPMFKPQGAKEVRRAAAAFIAMRQRIIRQISQRTALLTGVSHDLRTPLTRMKLQLEMMRGQDGVAELKEDVAEMERMLEGYLAFARGEGTEKPHLADVGVLVEEVVRQARRKGGHITMQTEAGLRVAVRPFAFQRCISNLIDNALRYATQVSVSAGRRREAVEVCVDDDGPGIPEDLREDVFKPFFRIEGSRNPVTGGIGLGLSIARDVIRSHGGEIQLGDSPMGGLRARIRLPI